MSAASGLDVSCRVPVGVCLSADGRGRSGKGTMAIAAPDPANASGSLRVLSACPSCCLLLLLSWSVLAACFCFGACLACVLLWSMGRVRLFACN